MGAIIARLRKKKTTFEKLEELDKNIKSIEQYKYNTQQTEKKIIGQFILISACIYIVSVILYYYYVLPSTLNEQLYYITPLLLVPFVIWLVKKVLKWYYTRKLKKNETKLLDLMKEKKKMLEQVMETETYKVAKTILEKFAPENLRKSPTYEGAKPSLPLSSSLTTATAQSPTTMTLRQRNVVLNQKSPQPPKSFALPASSHLSTPNPSSTSSTNGQRTGMFSISTPALSGTPALGWGSQNVPMARGILPRDRSVLDKMVEYLVGDGPNNRYALICKNCQSHNGMALREEFEYIAFRCCYCFSFNPSRKLRPAAPKLEVEHSPLRRRLSDKSETSESERNSGSDAESDVKERVPSRASSEKSSEDEIVDQDNKIESDDKPEKIDTQPEKSDE